MATFWNNCGQEEKRKISSNLPEDNDDDHMIDLSKDVAINLSTIGPINGH